MCELILVEHRIHAPEGADIPCMNGVYHGDKEAIERRESRAAKVYEGGCCCETRKTRILALFSNSMTTTLQSGRARKMS